MWRIFALRRGDRSPYAMARHLEEENVPTKRGGKWYPATVRYVLENARYRGLVEYYFRWNGEEYVLREGVHPAIIE